MTSSNQAIDRIAAAESFLVVVLAERPGPLNELQRELLASTLTRVQHVAAALQVLPVDTMDALDASIVGKPAPIAAQSDPQPSVDLRQR